MGLLVGGEAGRLILSEGKNDRGRGGAFLRYSSACRRNVAKWRWVWKTSRMSVR